MTVHNKEQKGPHCQFIAVCHKRV